MDIGDIVRDKLTGKKLIVVAIEKDAHDSAYKIHCRLYNNDKLESHRLYEFEVEP